MAHLLPQLRVNIGAFIDGCRLARFAPSRRAAHLLMHHPAHLPAALVNYIMYGPRNWPTPARLRAMLANILRTARAICAGARPRGQGGYESALQCVRALDAIARSANVPQAAKNQVARAMDYCNGRVSFMRL